MASSAVCRWWSPTTRPWAMRSQPPQPRLRGLLAAGALCLTASTAAIAAPSTAASAAGPTSLTIRSAATTTPSSGLADGAIKHVWLIILENKSYDATFTGLNKNSYLWQALPQQGVLLKNYYGTGHFSQDNYESMVSGQSPQQDTQSDCNVAATSFSDNSHIETGGGSLASNPNYGQADSLGMGNPPSNPSTGTTGYTPASGNVAYNPDGSNGCVYPSHVPTLFNQLDAAGKTWKGYAQDLHAQAGREDGPCGYPGTSTNAPSSATINASTPTSGPTQLNKPKSYPGVTSFAGAQAAGNDASGNPGAKEDGYVAKHFPFPWFHSLIDGITTPVSTAGDQTPSDCDGSHIANLDDQSQGLVHDLQSAATTPSFSWITPNNCSDAHDAICKGNNLSGAFKPNGDPNYDGVSPRFDPQATTPTNFTGGLYASDLFLKWYIPLIEQSPAFKDGGLIDVTFDEGFPPFVNNSFNNANDPSFAPGTVNPGVSKPATAATFLESDAAGQNINGTNVSSEPTGPNSPNATGGVCSADPCPGPGDNGFIDRTPPGARTDSAASAGAGNATVTDVAIRATDAGRTVYSPAGKSSTGAPTGTAIGFVGSPSDTGPLFPTTNTGAVTAGAFTLVDANGNAVTNHPALSGVTLGAQTSNPSDKAYDPLYDATDFTPGGGDTGSVLISPFITPGTSTTRYYNHYSWLRTMEDLFDVNQGSATTPLSPGAGTVSTGLDALGHLGYAAQSGLAPFGPDVFTNPKGDTATPAPPASLPEVSLAVGLPLVAIVLGGGLVYRRRTRKQLAG